MGFKDLFNKEINCARCAKVISKKEAGYYDASHQGKYKDGIAKKVCQDCLKELLCEDLLKFRDKLVVISPIPKKNAMVTYNLDELLKVNQASGMKAENEAFVSDLKTLMPMKTSLCEVCAHDATMTFCPSAIIGNDPFSWRIIKSESIKSIYLCPECMIMKLRNEFNEKNIRLYSIYPPVVGDSVLCSWEL